MSILNFKKTVNSKPFIAISILGKSYKVIIKYAQTNNINLTKKETEILLSLPKKYKNLDCSEFVIQAVQKMYLEIAPKEIENSLELVRHIVKFAPEDYKIQKLNNAFYKSINKKVLIINPDIVKYSKEIINTTMIQEFCKMKYGAKTKKYKENVKISLDTYEKFKAQKPIAYSKMA